MGLLKKKDGDDDSSRRALFGSKGKSKSQAPDSNPYAQPAIPPDPYTRAKMNAGIGQAPGQTYQGPPQPAQGGYGGMSQPQPNRAYGGPPSGYGDNKYGPPPGDNKYGAPQGGGYAPDRYANQGAYGGGSFGGNPSGGNPYGAPQASGVGRTGGYGGLGKTASHETAPDDNRDALFGSAAERLEQRQQQGPPDYAYQNQDPSGADTSYGAYGDRQLTAEEEEEEDISAAKSEIKFMKQQDVASTRNALRIAAQAEETGRNTLARLGAQGERMHNTDRNLDIANNQITVSDDKQKELRKLNRSMFAVHVGNPFTSAARQQEKDDRIMERHQMEREQREATREQAFKSTQRMNQNFKGLDDNYGSTGAIKKTNLAERSKYQFEADSDDDRMEDEIDRNLDDLTGAAKRLNLLAKATGSEIESQNRLIEGISQKVSIMLQLWSAFTNIRTERQIRRQNPYEHRAVASHTLRLSYIDSRSVAGMVHEEQGRARRRRMAQGVQGEMLLVWLDIQTCIYTLCLAPCESTVTRDRRHETGSANVSSLPQLSGTVGIDGIFYTW